MSWDGSRDDIRKVDSSRLQRRLNVELNRRQFLGAAGILGGGLALAACGLGQSGGGGSSGNKNPLLAMSVPTLGVAAIVDIVNGGKQFRTKAGIANDIEVLVSNGSTQTQVQQIQAFAAKAGPDNGLLFFLTAPADAVPLIVQTCEQAKVRFLTYPNKPHDMHPGSSPYWVAHAAYGYADEAAVLMAEMGKITGDKGNYVVLQGDPSSSQTASSQKVIDSYVASHPDIKIVANPDIKNFDKSVAFDTMTTILTKNPDIAAVWCANDDVAGGAIQALQQAGKKNVPVTGYDATAPIVGDIIAGTATASAGSQNVEAGFYGLAIPWGALLGKFDPVKLPQNKREIYAQFTLVNKDNAADYKKTHIDVIPQYSLADADLFSWATSKTSADFPG